MKTTEFKDLGISYTEQTDFQVFLHLVELPPIAGEDGLATLVASIANDKDTAHALQLSQYKTANIKTVSLTRLLETMGIEYASTQAAFSAVDKDDLERVQ